MHFFLHMCFKRSYFSVCWFLGTLMEEKALHGENLACHFIPKICILYGNTVVRGLAHWNLEYSHAGILKYPKKHGFWRHSKFNSQNFGKRGSILSFSVSLYMYIYIHGSSTSTYVHVCNIWILLYISIIKCVYGTCGFFL